MAAATKPTNRGETMITADCLYFLVDVPNNNDFAEKASRGVVK